jgi:hypothetical protein
MTDEGARPKSHGTEGRPLRLMELDSVGEWKGS